MAIERWEAKVKQYRLHQEGEEGTTAPDDSDDAFVVED